MNRVAQLLSGLMIVASFLVTCAPPTTGRIEGTVTRTDKKMPIVNARVSLNDETLDPKDSQSTIAEAKTDSQDRYSFTDVKPGVYGLSIDWVSPCNSGTFFAQKGWLIIIAAQPKGKLIATAREKFDLVAGSTIKKDLDLDLNFCP